MITPINRKATWMLSDLHRATEWQINVDNSFSGELRLATDQLRNESKVAPFFGKTAFPLDQAISPLISALKQSEQGPGFALLRGLNITDYSLTDLENMLWGIGSWLGDAVPQNRKGALIKHVKNDDGGLGEAYPFHTDRCDTLVLFYIRTGQQGGNIQLASVGNIYNFIATSNPELATLAFDNLPQDRRGEEAIGETPWMMLPIMALVDGILLGRYNRRFIESTQRFPDAPRLSAQHIALLDLIDKALSQPENVLEIAPQPGDILLINNHYLWHARTAYIDGTDESSQRLMLRLWLANKGSPRLPKSFEQIYGSTEPGVIRGGVPQSA
jgi:hypothetical protein